MENASPVDSTAMYTQGIPVLQPKLKWRPRWKQLLWIPKTSSPLLQHWWTMPWPKKTQRHYLLQVALHGQPIVYDNSCAPMNQQDMTSTSAWSTFPTTSSWKISVWRVPGASCSVPLINRSCWGRPRHGTAMWSSRLYGNPSTSCSVYTRLLKETLVTLNKFPLPSCTWPDATPRITRMCWRPWNGVWVATCWGRLWWISSGLCLPFHSGIMKEVPGAGTCHAIQGHHPCEAPEEPYQDLATYFRATWIEGNWCPAGWSIYQCSVRTNSDVEGWHRRLNGLAGRRSQPFYLSVRLLHREAETSRRQVKLVK